MGNFEKNQIGEPLIGCDNDSHDIRLIGASKDMKGVVREGFVCHTCKATWLKIHKPKDADFYDTMAEIGVDKL